MQSFRRQRSSPRQRTNSCSHCTIACRLFCSRATADSWLDGDNELLDFAAEFAPELRAWPVQKTVNSPRNEGEELLQPAGDAING